jgi:hypothetical protein
VAKGDTNKCTEKQFFEAMGRAMAAFQDVESHMGQLFTALIASRNDTAAQAVFYHLQNNSLRIQVMDIAARWLGLADARGKLRKRWETVRTKLRDASDLRNRIAHGDYYDFAPHPVLTKPLGDWSKLEPGKLLTHSKKTIERQVTYSMLVKAPDEWWKLCVEMMDLIEDINALYRRRGLDKVMFERVGKFAGGNEATES